MSAESFMDGRITLHPGDCRELLGTLEACSIDACVTDPPYHLQSIHKRFAAKGRDETSERYAAGPYGRTAKGFMGKQWDGGGIAFRPELWREVYRVLKPGAHLVAFGGTRTYHRMACAIEDAGFEIRDQMQWLYGSGFPKSHDVSKGIDRAAGAERREGELKTNGRGAWNLKIGNHGHGDTGIGHADGSKKTYRETLAATDESAKWSGFGTALKPACEPIVLARKPLSESTVAANVLKWGTGALNIDGCRVVTDEGGDRAGGIRPPVNEGYQRPGGSMFEKKSDWSMPASGRWPANVIHDGSPEVAEGFPESASSASSASSDEPNYKNQVYGRGMGGIVSPDNQYSDSGSAARFFYTAKADSDDRLGSKHPTVKPLDLMQWLVRLVTPPKGLVLDPFSGTGTTGEATFREGMRAVLIEREEEYQNDIRRRMKLAMSGPLERSRESIKARMKDKPADHGPLFAGSDTPRTGRQIYGVFADERSARSD